MQFSKLCEYFEKLEQTSSRLTLIDILSDLFKKSSKDEIEKIVYLTQGRIAPFFEPLEIGMAEKNVAQAVAMAFGSTKEDVLKLYGKLGDMGKAAEQLSSKFKVLASQRSGQSSKLSVGDVFEVLTKIARTGGHGSVEKKQNMLTDLLKKVDSVCAKHLVRIPLGNLRLGIGDPTILDALATAKLGNKTKRKVLEGAYNRTSDLGLIAKILWAHGLPAVEKLKVIIGKPIRSELCERLPTPEKAIEKMGIVDVQYKYDGFRVEIHLDRRPTGLNAQNLVGQDEVKMFSRNLENMTHMFPELIEATRVQVKAKTAILDTEALAYNVESEEFLPFQETTKRRRKHGIEEMAKKLPLRAFVFDVMYLNGKSLIDENLESRIKNLEKNIKGDEVLISQPGEIV